MRSLFSTSLLSTDEDFIPPTCSAVLLLHYNPRVCYIFRRVPDWVRKSALTTTKHLLSNDRLYMTPPARDRPKHQPTKIRRSYTETSRHLARSVTDSASSPVDSNCEPIRAGSDVLTACRIARRLDACKRRPGVPLLQFLGYSSSTVDETEVSEVCFESISQHGVISRPLPCATPVLLRTANVAQGHSLPYRFGQFVFVEVPVVSNILKECVDGIAFVASIVVIF